MQNRLHTVAARKASAAADRKLLRQEEHPPNSERSSLQKPEDSRTATAVEPCRLELILHRLQQNFYDQAPALGRIAAAVLVDLKTLDEGSPFPH